jgi:hypothetical protein
MKKRNCNLYIIISLCFLLLLGMTEISRGGEYKYDNYYWLSANINLTENDFINIAYFEEWDQIVVVSATSQIYTKKSYENQWNPLPIETDEQIVFILLDPNGKIIVQTPLHLLAKEDSDADWKQIVLPIPTPTNRNIQLFSIVVLDSFLLVDQSNLWIYSDEKWSQIANPNQLLFQSFAYDSFKNRVYMGTQHGLWTLDFVSGTLAKSYVPFKDSSIVNLFIPKDTYNSWFAITNTGGLYRSLDLGKSFEPAGQIGTNNQIYQFCEDETRSGVFFAFTKQGVFLTADQGTGWIRMQNGIENIETQAGCFVPYEQRFYIATTGKGLRSSFAIPNQPEPIQPKEGEDVFYFKPTLAWNLFGGNNLPGSYHVIVSLTQDFLNIVFEKQNIMGDSIMIPENRLKLHTPYFWKVRVETQYWNSDWSTVYQFTPRQQWIFIPNQLKYQWNEKIVTFQKQDEVIPFIVKGVFYLPLRSFLESLGALVYWQPQKEQVEVVFKEKTIILPIHSLEYPIQIKKNRAYIQIRCLIDLYEWTLEWDAKHGSVIVKEIY